MARCVLTAVFQIRTKLTSHTYEREVLEMYSQVTTNIFNFLHLKIVLGNLGL